MQKQYRDILRSETSSSYWSNAEYIYPKYEFLEGGCCFTSIRTLECLECLKISSHSFCLHARELDKIHQNSDNLVVELLPPSIKALRILEVNPRTFPVLKYLANSATLQFTHLTDAYIETPRTRLSRGNRGGLCRSIYICTFFPN